MENKEHPLEALAGEIERRGIVVIEHVTRLPVYDEPYLSPHLIVCLNHQGRVKAEYDMQKVEFTPHEIAMLMPNHTLTVYESSDDYCATLLVISGTFLKWLAQKVTTFSFFQLHNVSSSPLTDEQFYSMLTYFKMLQAISQIDHPARKEMLAAQIAVGTRMCDLYLYNNEKNGTKPQTEKQRLLSRFYEAVTKHYKESREVKFYAQLLCLSPKHFGMIVHQQTGLRATQWIARYVVIQAKALLRQRTDLSIQQVAHEVGFEDSASFTRYFKATAGMTPGEYRRGD